MNGKGSKPRDQTPGPDGKTPSRRYADNWEATFGRCVDGAPHRWNDYGVCLACRQVEPRRTRD